MIQAKEGITPEEFESRLTPPAGLALSRAADPETSHLAADEIAQSLSRRQQTALAVVIRWPGRTVSELSELNDCRDPRTIGRRLPELERQGLVRREDARECRITGRLAHTWRATKP
jgi:predicted transcriptional regulator